MNIKITILIILPILLLNCRNNNNEKILSVDEIIEKQLDSLRSIENSRNVSVNKLEEKIAVGNIKFGITEQEFQIEKKKFIQATDGKIGPLKYRMIDEYYDNGNDLRYLILAGEDKDYSYYKCCLNSDYNELKTILTKKYGSSTSKFSNNNTQSTGWQIGNKSIQLYLTFDEYSNKYNISIVFQYQTQEEKDNIEAEIRRREKEELKKAVEKL